MSAISVRVCLLSASALSLPFAGCAEPLEMEGVSTQHSHTADDDEGSVSIVHQERDDITAIRAYPTDAVLHPSVLNECLEIESLDGNRVRMDCTEATEALIAMRFPDAPGRLAHRLVIIAHSNDDGTYSPGSSGLPCRLTGLETASRAGALPFMDQIGFYFSGETRVARHFSSTDLDVVHTAMGRDNEARVVHRFYAALPCWAGTASSSHNATYQFKPYMDFVGNDGKVYRNWDAVAENYLLTGGAGATAFDRSGEVFP